MKEQPSQKKFRWIIVTLFIAYMLVGSIWIYWKGYHKGYNDAKQEAQPIIVNDNAKVR